MSVGFPDYLWAARRLLRKWRGSPPQTVTKRGDPRGNLGQLSGQGELYCARKYRSSAYGEKAKTQGRTY